MAGEEGKMDMMFEVVVLSVEGDSEVGDIEKKGVTIHMENILVTEEETTVVSPLQVDAAVFASNFKGMLKPEMRKYLERYDRSMLKIWLLKSGKDFNDELITRHNFICVQGDKTCERVLKQFFVQLNFFLTRLVQKLDLNESKTVEPEDLSVYAEQFGMDFTPQDLDAFLSEYQDQGDPFLTPRGILQWVKKGKPESKVGTIIMKVIQAKNLLRGYPWTIKKVFLGEDIPMLKPHQLTGQVEVTVGERDFPVGSRSEVHVWSRNRLPHPHPADLLGAAAGDSDIIISVSLQRNPERSFTQIQDFMRNAVFKIETGFHAASKETCTTVSLDYRITDTEATLYLLLNYLNIAGNDSTFRREIKLIRALLASSKGCEFHLQCESKTAIKDLLARGGEQFQDYLSTGMRTTLSYSLDSTIRDTLFNVVSRDVKPLPIFLIRELNLRTHFDSVKDLPEGLQKVVNKRIPTEISTLDGLFFFLGKVLNSELKAKALEKQLELILQTGAELFDLTDVKIGGTLFNLVAELHLHFPGLEDLVRMDIGEIRRKAEELKRVKDVESEQGSEESSGSEKKRKPPKAVCERGRHEEENSISQKSMSPRSSNSSGIIQLQERRQSIHLNRSGSLKSAGRRKSGGLSDRSSGSEVRKRSIDSGSSGSVHIEQPSRRAPDPAFQISPRSSRSVSPRTPVSQEELSD